jgi:N-carbamoylputrescine amidase
MRNVIVAAAQMSCGELPAENLKKAERMVRTAAARGANIILLQELFETPYFCQREDAAVYGWATETERNPAVRRFLKVAKELNVVIPVSFYEKKNNVRYNSVAVIDADGSLLGVYRKSHIPDGPGYEEKFYFSPGDTGFKVWDTKFGRIGVGICWDQWFPEAARCMALLGAELLLYPTAIGSEPEAPEIDSKDHWQRCMAGHAACNLVPVAAANRVGKETSGPSSIEFYGSSFIAGPTGEILTQAGRTEETVLTAAFDLDAIEAQRAEWGVFRDRRPELYRPLLTLDGIT